MPEVRSPFRPQRATRRGKPPAQRLISCLAFIGSAGLALGGCTGSFGTVAPRADDGPGAGSGGGAGLGGGAGSGGGVGSGGAGVAGSDGVGAGAGAGATGSLSSVPQLMPLRRLSQIEYQNTLKDLLGATVKVTVTLPGDPIGPATYGFPTSIGGVEQDLLEDGASDAVASAGAAVIPTCAAGADQRGCAGEFVKSFGKRAFRRPVTTDEQTLLLELYDNVRKAPTSFDHAAAMKTVLTTILQSPRFLYHWELGATKPVAASGGLVRLSGWEIASRLSYLLWGTMPDAELFTAAETGKLDTTAGIETQARRLLADKKRAAHFATNVFSQWVGIEKLPGLLKDKAVIASFSDALKSGIVGETEQVLAKAVLETGTLSSLLTSRETFVNAATAPIYGVAPPAQGFAAQTLPATRSGFFTRLAFLAIKALPQESSPVHRGKVISTRLLCNRILPPPPDLMINPPPVADDVQTREAYASHMNNPGCVTCHKLLDPYGFAFENFDAVGRYRDTEANRPIDASGTITMDGKQVTYKDAPDLMVKLAASAQVRACATSQLLRYALAREVGAEDATSLAAITKSFDGSGGDFRELAVAIATSDAFRLRLPAENEVLQ